MTFFANIVRNAAFAATLLAIASGACSCGGTTARTSDKPDAIANTATTTPPPPDPAPLLAPSPILSVLSVEHQVDISGERDGVVVSIEQEEGSFAKAGTTLGRLDDRTVQMELIKARDDLRVSQNNVKFKEAELKAKGATYQRQQQLRALGLSSQADLEAAEFEAKGAEYDLYGWEALVESNQAEIHRIEIQIDQTHLRAPFSGVVVRRYIKEGQAISKGDKCFRLSQLGPLQVQFQVPEDSSPRPVSGAEVGLEPVGEAGRTLTARIVKVSPTIDPASDSYNVTAQLTGPVSPDLRPGMAVHVFWPAAPRSKPR